MIMTALKHLVLGQCVTQKTNTVAELGFGPRWSDSGVRALHYFTSGVHAPLGCVRKPLGHRKKILDFSFLCTFFTEVRKESFC